MTVAGAQLAGMGMDAAIGLLKEAVDKTLSEE